DRSCAWSELAPRLSCRARRAAQPSRVLRRLRRSPAHGRARRESGRRHRRDARVPRVYAARFPIRSMRPSAAFGGSDDRSMAADNTWAFNCRYAVAPGPKRWSVHAYGEAIDVDTVENPYVVGGRVLPPAGRAYLDRTRPRPGMAVTGGVLVRAFASVGWLWGGRWAGSPDWQHFSRTGGWQPIDFSERGGEPRPHEGKRECQCAADHDTPRRAREPGGGAPPPTPPPVPPPRENRSRPPC